MLREEYARSARISSGPEFLEARRLLASFGTPWPNAREMTASFVADGTRVANTVSNANAELSSIATQSDWHELALRSLQTWAYHADINIGLVVDHGQRMGAPGKIESDPRFGDIRIGAADQGFGVLANTLPYQVIAGTLSGDLLLNSSTSYLYYGWQDSTPPASPLPTSHPDLFSVLLHESGNAFGIEDNSQFDSVMFAQYTDPKGVLTEMDIAEIQRLYGERQDPFEPTSNDLPTLATIVPAHSDTDAAAGVVEVSGSLRSNTDVDHYIYSAPEHSSSVVIRLEARGISLLTGDLQVTNSVGEELGRVTVESVFNNDAELQLENLVEHGDLIVRVQSKDDSAYSVGDYRLVFDHRDLSTRQQDATQAEYLSGNEQLWENFDLIDFEVGQNDTPSTAEGIQPTHASGNHTRFEFESSVFSQGDGIADVDLFRFDAPANTMDRLVVHVSPVGGTSPELKVELLNENGAVAGANGRLRPDGTWSLELAEPIPGDTYLVSVSVDPSSSVHDGNYVGIIDVAGQSDDLEQLASGVLPSGEETFVPFTSHKAQIHRFELSAGQGSDEAFVRLTILDAFSAAPVFSLITRADRTRHAFALLPQGDFILRFSREDTVDPTMGPMSFGLAYAGISDDEGGEGGEGSGSYYSSYYYYDYGGSSYP